MFEQEVFLHMPGLPIANIYLVIGNRNALSICIFYQGSDKLTGGFKVPCQRISPQAKDETIIRRQRLWPKSRRPVQGRSIQSEVFDFLRLTRRQSDNREDEFLLGRILFLMTYDTTLNFETLIKENHLDESINEVKQRMLMPVS